VPVCDGREQTAAVGGAEDGNIDQVIDGCLVEPLSGDVDEHRMRGQVAIRCFLCSIAFSLLEPSGSHALTTTSRLSRSPSCAHALALLSFLSTRLLSSLCHLS